MRLPKPLIGLVGIFIASLVMAAQSGEGANFIKSKLLNTPSAPYKLAASHNGRGYEFCNSSAVRVTTYRLGCVEKKSTGLKILVERQVETGNLDPPNGKLESCVLWDCRDCLFPGDACKNGKLAVTEVNLADGTTWKLK